MKKIFEVKFLAHNKPQSIRIEGAATITEAVNAAEMVLHNFLNAEADICGAFEVYNGGVTR